MRRTYMVAAALIALVVAPVADRALAAVDITKTTYSTYGECYKLSNGTVEVIATTALGPRIISYKLVGGNNMLGELGRETVVKTDLGDWRPWGGHRLWHAPEEMPRTYAPDDSPVEAEVIGGNSIRLVQQVEPATHIRKEILVALDESGTCVKLTHKLTNMGVWPVELACWALTVMSSGGVTIIPNEPYVSHDDSLLPARPMVLWQYTDLSDPRWLIGTKYVRLVNDPEKDTPQKIGVMNKQGWAAYLKDNTLFVKRFPYEDGADYPDYGSNCETYTSGSFMEIETLGPLVKLAPNQSVTHIERWHMFTNIDAGASESSLDKAISPLVAKTK